MRLYAGWFWMEPRHDQVDLVEVDLSYYGARERTKTYRMDICKETNDRKENGRDRGKVADEDH